MSWSGRIGLVLLGASLPVVAVGVVVLSMSARSAVRSGAPAGWTTVRPWGAVDFEIARDAEASGVERSIAQSLRDEGATDFDPDSDGIKNYDFLALSGGGSHGAFGAGILVGWSARGDRPDFKIVTGVSTGALQATPAFLGADADDMLRDAFTGISNADVCLERSPISALFADSARDTAPLRVLLERLIDDEVLAAVAAKHRRGGRLFVGTTNIDGGEFVMWDLGAIAASGRPDARTRYIDVLMASAAVPALFPPVYFDVEFDGEVHRQMHVDGGAASQLFFRGFMLDLEDAMGTLGAGRPHMRLFLLRNGGARGGVSNDLVQPTTLGIASASIEQLFRLSTSSSLFRVFQLAGRYGIEFNLRIIPDDMMPAFANTNFDPAGMTALFEAAEALARRSGEWASIPPGLDPDELQAIGGDDLDGGEAISTP